MSAERSLLGLASVTGLTVVSQRECHSRRPPIGDSNIYHLGGCGAAGGNETASRRDGVVYRNVWAADGNCRRFVKNRLITILALVGGPNPPVVTPLGHNPPVMTQWDRNPLGHNPLPIGSRVCIMRVVLSQ